MSTNQTPGVLAGSLLAPVSPGPQATAVLVGRHESVASLREKKPSSLTSLALPLLTDAHSAPENWR